MTTPAPEPARRLAGLLCDPARAAVFAAVVLGAGSATEVTAVAALTAEEVRRCLRQLAVAGVVTGADGTLVAELGRFADAAAGRTSDPGRGEADPARATVLRTFLDDAGRIREIPTTAAKRRVVLEHVSGAFAIGERYPEREVTVMLKAFHPDHAALRRYLVEGDLLARGDGFYWRSGGPVEV